MLSRVTQLIVRVADLAEAEGRTLREVARVEGRVLRKSTAKLGLGFAVLLATAPLVIIGVCLLLAALFMALREPIGQPAAAAITGVVTLAVSGGLLWLFKTLTA